MGRVIVLSLLVVACGTGDQAASTASKAQNDWNRAMWYAIQGDDFDEVRSLLNEHPKWINSERHRSGATPLYFAMTYKNVRPEIAIYLLDHGGDPDAQNEESGTTLLHKAIYEDRFDNLKLLIEYGANPMVKDVKGRTPRDLANFYGGRSTHMAEALEAYEHTYQGP